MIPVAAYVINVCNFTGKELDQPDKGIKKILKENHMYGKQCSDERLYLRKEPPGSSSYANDEVVFDFYEI